MDFIWTNWFSFNNPQYETYHLRESNETELNRNKWTVVDGHEKTSKLHTADLFSKLRNSQYLQTQKLHCHVYKTCLSPEPRTFSTRIPIQFFQNQFSCYTPSYLQAFQLSYNVQIFSS